MKKTFLTIGLASMMTAGVFAQGTFGFGNAASSVNAPISQAAGAGGGLVPDGSTFTVAYYWSTANSVVGGVLQGATLGANSVNPSAAPGYFFGGTQAIAGQTGTVFVQDVVYTTSAGSLAAAEATPGDQYGLFNVTSEALASGANTPPQQVGLTALTLTLVPTPEPTTLALGGLGAAALLLFRRRK